MESNSPGKLSRTLVVDAHNLIHRVCHVESFANLTDKDGRFTGGIFGLLSILSINMRRWPVSRCIAVWDAGRSQRRMAILPSYKANRAPRPEEREEHERYSASVKDQIETLLTILPSLGVRNLSIDGREGDDVIGLYCRSVQGYKTVFTGDRDLLQLVNESTSVFLSDKEREVHMGNFKDEVKVPRPLFLLRKVLMGDKSDNIPGIPGVGETTVDRVMATVSNVVESSKGQGSLRLSELVSSACSILSESDKRNAKRYSAVSGGTDVILRNYDLIDISREVFDPVDVADMHCVLGRPAYFNSDAAQAALRGLGFNSFLSTWEDFSRPFSMLS